MKKRFLCVFLAMLLCSGTVMLTASCEKKPSEGTDVSSDTASSSEAPADSQTEKETEGETSAANTEKNPDITSIASLTPADGKKLKIAFVGDSITQGTGTSNQSAESYPGQLQALLDRTKYTVGNFGRASAYTLPAKSPFNVWASSKTKLSYKDTDQFSQSKLFKPDVVVIMLGTNDMRSMISDVARSAYKAALKDLCEVYLSQKQVQKVYIATSIHVVSNFGAKQMSDGFLQQAQREVAEELGLEVLDMYSKTREYMDAMFHYTSDRLHPNKEMYGVMAKAFKAMLFGEEYEAPTAPKSESNVVYLKASGSASANGKTPETAVNKLGIAVSLVREGGTVVVCGAYSVNYESHLPENSGLITITSKYNGVDYASKGAKLGISKHLAFYGDYKIENINIHYEASSALIGCNYNDITFGDGITSTSNSSAYPVVVCGYIVDSGTKCENVSLKGEANITFNSGKWSYINGGNRRSKGTLTVGSSEKDAVINITVNGGEYLLASGSNLMCAVGMNSFAGTCNFTVNGGSFAGNLYAVGRIGSNETKNPSEMSGTVNMVINGGSFNAKIIEKQDNTTKLTGKVNITIPAALEGKLVGFTNITKK